jgi:L-threonylcarbamoyladenylate synthase
VTAGLDTVGLRIPANPIALALIREAGVPIAAPSANRFTQLSPTRAGHVQLGILVLDGGPADVGIESTVLAFHPPCLLRPGAITREQIETVIGPVSSVAPDGPHRSPGQHPRHYQPRTPLIITSKLPEGRGAYLFLTAAAPATMPVQMPPDARAYAQRLYAVLHELDAQNLDWIAVEPVPLGSEWDGIRDRLTRASAK